MGVLELLFTLAGAASAATTSHRSWSVVQSPNLSPNANVLTSVAVITPTNVLAVGYYVKSVSKGSTVDQTLVAEWNGSQWKVVSSPNAGLGNNVLTGVAVVSASNAWAVGYYDSGSGTPSQTLVEQWNGSAWKIVSSPNTGSSSGLLSVVAVSASDLWAAGGSSNGTLIEHWNGSLWSIVHSPNPGASLNTLSSVAAVSTNDVVAVGSYCTGVGCNMGGGFIKTLVEEWNGSQWNVLPTPNVREFNSLSSVTALSATDLWAVGSSADTGPRYTLTEHWNGSAWKIVTSPNFGTGTNELLGVTAVSANNVVAVGVSFSAHAPSLIERWNGSAWSLSTGPKPAGSQLNAVIDVSGMYQLWTVGSYSGGTLTEHYR